MLLNKYIDDLLTLLVFSGLLFSYFYYVNSSYAHIYFNSLEFYSIKVCTVGIN